MKSSKHFLKKSVESYIDSFCIYLLQNRGYSLLTAKSYKETLREAFVYIELYKEGEKTVCDLMPYRVHIAPLKAKTISKKLSALRSFAEYLRDEGEVFELLNDTTVKVPKTLPKPIAHEHIVEALREAGLQERVLVLLLYTLGLRISELTSLKKTDFKSGWVRVVGKGAKERDIPLLPQLWELLDEYISESMIKNYIFEKNGEKLSENSLRYMLTKVFKKIGLHVTPHQLRHSYATGLLNNGAPIADVSELLGHASMATTQIYTKLGSALKEKNYKQAHPLCKDEI